MATKSSEYWKGRFDQVEQSANNKSVKYTKQLDKKYKVAAKEIDTKINAWYNRIAINNNVSVEEARKLLTNSELKEFKWDVQQYIEAGQQNAIDQRWMKELENASAKFHINRLEALKLECRQQIEVALANGQQSMFDVLGDVYKDTFYHSCFEIQKGVGVGFDVSKLDNSKVQTLLNKPWSVDGENFSTKIWKNKTKLINNLDQELSRMVLTGESPKKTIENIKKSMNTSLYNAKRLVMTEQAYFTTLGQKDAFGELDVEEYEIVATLDSRTSEKCQGMDGQHFPVKDMQPGVNAPPFHVFCRSTTCPYFDDEFTINDKRVAKGEDGEWYEVPANMTYPEWKKSFVDGGSKDELSDAREIIKKGKKVFDNVTRMNPSVSLVDLDGKYVDELKNILDGTEPNFRRLILGNGDKIPFAKINAIGGNRSTSNGIFVNLAKDRINEKGPWTSSLHEIGHVIDKIYSRPSHSDVFGKAIISDFSAFTKRYTSLYNISIDEAYVRISKNLERASVRESHILSDLFGALTDNQCSGGIGHNNEYWKHEYHLEQETFAHFFSVSALGYDDKIAVLKGVFPNAYSEFLKIVGGL